MAQLEGGLRPLSEGETQIDEAPLGSRGTLWSILEESFEGLYLRHSKRTLDEIETVRVARRSGAPVGLIMVKKLAPKVGYVYYVAVARSERGKGIAAMLLEDALEKFKSEGIDDVYASVEEDNVPSGRLFAAHGFSRTGMVEVAKRFGALHAVSMYRVMMVVPGEVLLHKSLP
ncbi:MAG: GNAT family N-acetyltransferase [Nitrososphaerota archaeon]|jgi:ribosomal protein S18 acetylase RimI-like enzyme|nr:GNAT family N-acetyltransferase [Nitrososphaerota archaeon]MDG6941872.1 GNAT family N-acetyltransferase [Nitrososphaerota archaeon]MDG6946955.1 GNAT family N-acetyltransferase [Nitrososphaerota archaeon]MDG6950633.1 GNAT family N-acetyltransferase [Nitrososphaerota archaeon]